VSDSPGTIRVAAGVLRQLAAHARHAAPRECCGLLVGTHQRIVECVATANLDPHPSRYQVDPAAHIALNRRLRGTGRTVVGVYHSHPRGGAEPSPTDVAEALYPAFVHVIVSALDEAVPIIGAYRIISGRVDRLTVEEECDGQSS
jgi:proteasome lid subunit RPN8/RPN11